MRARVRHGAGKRALLMCVSMMIDSDYKSRKNHITVCQSVARCVRKIECHRKLQQQKLNMINKVSAISGTNCAWEMGHFANAIYSIWQSNADIICAISEALVQINYHRRNYVSRLRRVRKKGWHPAPIDGFAFSIWSLRLTFCHAAALRQTNSNQNADTWPMIEFFFFINEFSLCSLSPSLAPSPNRSYTDCILFLSQFRRHFNHLLSMLTLTTSLFNVHICIHDTKSIEFSESSIIFPHFCLLLFGLIGKPTYIRVCFHIRSFIRIKYAIFAHERETTTKKKRKLSMFKTKGNRQRQNREKTNSFFVVVLRSVMFFSCFFLYIISIDEEFWWHKKPWWTWRGEGRARECEREKRKHLNNGNRTEMNRE